MEVIWVIPSLSTKPSRAPSHRPSALGCSLVLAVLSLVQPEHSFSLAQAVLEGHALPQYGW